MSYYIVALVIGAFTFSPTASAAPPPGASAAGYTVNTFSSAFTRTTVDLANSAGPGFAWYPWNFFGSHAKTSAIILNADQSVTLQGDTTGPGGELTSATPARNSRHFVGTAFGGGAYIEAEFKFNPADVRPSEAKGWPAFWSMTLESSITHTAHWPGQPVGYVHAIEVDFFEYLFPHYGGGSKNEYASGLHDWYGIPNVTCPHGLCDEHTPSHVGKRTTSQATDFTQYHRYGLLWVPATETASGYTRVYFDGKPLGSDQHWTKYTNQPPPPSKQPWTFGWLDQQHLILILGTGPNEPLTIRAVNVWQASAAQNLRD